MNLLVNYTFGDKNNYLSLKKSNPLGEPDDDSNLG